MGPRLLGSGASIQHARRLRELHGRGRKRRSRPGDLRRELQAPRRGEEEIRPEESLPGEPKHPPRALTRRGARAPLRIAAEAAPLSLLKRAKQRSGLKK